MNTTIREYEEAIWAAAFNRDKTAFSALVDENAVMICGGCRCSGAQYAEIIPQFDISGFTIEDFEVIAETDTLSQVHYIVTTLPGAPENADLAGRFHVVSTWKKAAGKAILIFNMDSRIYD